MRTNGGACFSRRAVCNNAPPLTGLQVCYIPLARKNNLTIHKADAEKRQSSSCGSRIHQQGDAYLRGSHGATNIKAIPW